MNKKNFFKFAESMKLKMARQKIIIWSQFFVKFLH